MNYKESEKIKSALLAANTIFINCHRGPDADSVGSALAIYLYLRKLGKSAHVVCVDTIPDQFKFIPGAETISQVDYDELDYKSIDLFVAVDSGEWRMVTRSQEKPPEGLRVLVIDHHETNPGYGDINLIKPEVSSCAEVIFKVFEDLEADFDKEIATALLTGIIGDTGTFQYPGVTAETFSVAQKLMSEGADKNRIIFNLFRRNKILELKFLGKVLDNIQLDKEHKFVWSVVKYEDYKDLGNAGAEAKSYAASLFGQTVEGTDFGMIATETQEGILKISFRSRTGFDISALAGLLGGGGHKAAAGGEVRAENIEKAIEIMLKTARAYAKKHSKESRAE